VLAASPVAATIDDDGNFEFANVAPGEYVMQASVSGRGPADEGESASQFIVVGGSDVTGLLVRLSRGSTVRGRIVIDGTIGPPDTFFNVDLQALPTDMDLTPQNLQVGPASAQIEGDGSFVLEGLRGPRLFRLYSPRWAVKAVTVNGVDVTDAPVPFGSAAQSLDGVEVVLTDRIAVIEGRAVDGRNRPVAHARVILFSTSRSLWGEASRFMASAQAGRDGTFTLRNVIPGDYYAVAVNGADADGWPDPELLDLLAPSATRLVIADAGPVTLTLQVR
jgi:hypothetical protein